MSKKDFISEIKSNVKDKKKETDEQNENELKNDSDNENQKTTGVVKEIATSNSNQPKNLDDLFADDDQTTVKKTKKTKKNPTKNQKENQKPNYFNSKNTQNLMNYDKEMMKKKKITDNKKFDVSKLNSHTKDNDKIKASKSYLEKNIENSYKEYENVEKPQFTNLKVDKDKDNFVELNKNEDVRIFFNF